jgi:hypothetical protein
MNPIRTTTLSPTIADSSSGVSTPPVTDAQRSHIPFYHPTNIEQDTIDHQAEEKMKEFFDCQETAYIKWIKQHPDEALKNDYVIFQNGEPIKRGPTYAHAMTGVVGLAYCTCVTRKDTPHISRLYPA